MDANDELEQFTDTVGPVTSEMVACGIVVSCWRDAIEPHYRLLTDPEMAYINISTTVAVAQFCTPTSVDWPGVRSVLLDPDRVILPGRTPREIAHDEWDELCEAVSERLDAEQPSAVAHAGWALIVCADWWGMPGYPNQVAGLLKTGRVTRSQRTAKELREALLSDPLSVPLEVWDQIVGGNGLGWLDRE